MNIAIYIGLGIAVGLLYGWAFYASSTYKKLVERKLPTRTRAIPLLVKFVSLAIAAFALIGAMVLIGADRTHSWIKLILFVVCWVLVSFFFKRLSGLLRR